MWLGSWFLVRPKKVVDCKSLKVKILLCAPRKKKRRREKALHHTRERGKARKGDQLDRVHSLCLKRASNSSRRGYHTDHTHTCVRSFQPPTPRRAGCKRERHGSCESGVGGGVFFFILRVRRAHFGRDAGSLSSRRSVASRYAA